jgi:hypothetical protein
MIHRGWVSALLITGTVAACGDSSSGVSGLSVMADNNHLVAVAYREFGQAEAACIDKVKSGEIQAEADAISCLDTGLSASGLVQRVKTLRQQVVTIGQNGSDVCQKAAKTYAGRIQAEESALGELHHDLVNDDFDAFNRDFADAGEAAKSEEATGEAIVDACR